MALYEYECPECGVIEVEHKISETLETCPKCKEQGKESFIKRLISLSSFRLKGKGWYQTDYAKKN